MPMCPIQYDPQLVEAAVNLATRANPATERDLRRSLEPVYCHAEPDERDALFQGAYARWFVDLGLSDVVVSWMGEFPRIGTDVQLVLVRPAARARLQAADLFVRASERPESTSRTLIIRICPESLCFPQQAQDIFLRELMHVADMLDPEFGYEPLVVDGTPARQQLIKDRYRVLWDLQVEKRLAAGFKLGNCNIIGLRASLERVFSTGDATEGLFDLLWHSEPVGHRQLLEWTEQPRRASEPVAPLAQSLH